VSGSKKPAIDGQLIIMAAGDKALFDLVLVRAGLIAD
jgi:3-hydroxyisobutyrate dehydrogenase-like beta-hydroxyacid dehydrogenase